MLHTFIQTQLKCSNWVESFLPEKLSIEGGRVFLDTTIPSHLNKNLTIYEIGGG